MIFQSFNMLQHTKANPAKHYSLKLWITSIRSHSRYMHKTPTVEPVESFAESP